jgi:hypothetical protein
MEMGVADCFIRIIIFEECDDIATAGDRNNLWPSLLVPRGCHFEAGQRMVIGPADMLPSRDPLATCIIQRNDIPPVDQ